MNFRRRPTASEEAETERIRSAARRAIAAFVARGEPLPDELLVDYRAQVVEREPVDDGEVF